MKKKALTITVILMFSLLLVFLSSVIGGVRVENALELEGAFPRDVGLPLPFVELQGAKIDPPLPHYYSSSDCCYRVYSWDNYLISTGIVFTIILLVTGVFIGFIKRKETN